MSKHSRLTMLRGMLKTFKSQTGADPRRGHVVVVDVGGANALLREIFFDRLPRGVVVTREHDELFRVDGVPVTLRYEIPYGSAFVVPWSDIPKQRCCDDVAVSTMLACMSRGSA